MRRTCFAMRASTASDRQPGLAGSCGAYGKGDDVVSYSFDVSLLPGAFARMMRPFGALNTGG